MGFERLRIAWRIWRGGGEPGMVLRVSSRMQVVPWMRSDILAREGGDSREVTDEVEGGALGGEEAACGPADFGEERCAGRDFVAIVHELFEAGLRALRFRKPRGLRARPAITMAWRARMTPLKRRASGITDAEVMSPEPMSSASAAAMTSRFMSASPCGPTYRYCDRHFEHSLERLERGEAQGLGQLNARGVVAHREIDFLQRVERHEGAAGATAAAVRARDGEEEFVRSGLFHLMDDVAFGADDEFARA